MFVKGERSASDLEQDVDRKGRQVLELVELKPGMVVADILGGGGYYSELIAEKIAPYGRVYLHNNQAYLPHVGKEVAARLKDNRLENVIRHDRETGDLAFIDQSLDMIFFILGYHDIYHVDKNWKIDRDDFIRQLKTALKPGGQLLIIDHSAPDGSGTKYSQDLHRIDKAYVIGELKQKGFKLIKESDLLVNDKDSREISPFHPDIRRKTDRFILLFQK
ncbi:class I SAM-dependent methyltransferase [Thalassomonas actiniarum]|uniref:Class I SAM-dependent methyltransferase n=1 Tax=Thalassomonas actiniarum TaxID=485447 RepID=A0AAE9YNR8_9GAMM|nr:class I SAM-dependent methyltransferase [Thalassomonas actiniarum]WDD97469.1 class I SAM-dependent methyltransferase [Thalassomonas actiniarum]